MALTRSKRARSPAASVASAGVADPGGDAYFQRLIAEQIQADISAENPPSESEDEILDDDDSLSVGTVDSSDGEDASDASSVRDAHDPDDVALDDVSETGARDSAQRDEIAIAEGKEEETNPPPPSLPLLAPDVADAGEAVPPAERPDLDVRDGGDAVPLEAMRDEITTTRTKRWGTSPRAPPATATAASTRSGPSASSSTTSGASPRCTSPCIEGTAPPSVVEKCWTCC